MQSKYFQESQILIQLLTSDNRIPELICKYFYDVAFLTQFEKTQGQSFMKKFSQFVQYRIYQQDEVILEQGKPVNSLYIFMYGQVGKHLSKKDKNFEQIQDKTALGEIYFLTRQASKFCFTALQPSVICYLTKENFYKIVKKKNISMSLINELLQYSFFSQFPINFIEQICQRSQTLNCLNHQIIYDINSEPMSWFIILQGEFQIFFNHNKKYYPLILLSSGDYFGDLEIIKKTQRQYKVQCISNDSTLLEIKKQNFLSLYYQEPYFQDVVKQNIQNRIISYDEIIKQNIFTLDLPLTSRRSRSKIQFKSIHIKIKSNNSSIDPNIQEFFSERDKALQNLLQQKKQKKETKKTLYQRLREQNPRLLQFLEKMGESKLQSSIIKQKQLESTKQFPSIQTNQMIESIQSYSPTPIFSCKRDSPIRIRQLTRNRNQNSNSSSVHTLQQTQEILTNMGNKRYFHLLFHKKQQ